MYSLSLQSSSFTHTDIYETLPGEHPIKAAGLTLTRVQTKLRNSHDRCTRNRRKRHHWLNSEKDLFDRLFKKEIRRCRQAPQDRLSEKAFRGGDTLFLHTSLFHKTTLRHDLFFLLSYIWQFATPSWLIEQVPPPRREPPTTPMGLSGLKVTTSVCAT